MCANRVWTSWLRVVDILFVRGVSVTSTASSRPINSFTHNALSHCDNNTTTFLALKSTFQPQQSPFPQTILVHRRLKKRWSHWRAWSHSCCWNHWCHWNHQSVTIHVGTLTSDHWDSVGDGICHEHAIPQGIPGISAAMQLRSKWISGRWFDPPREIREVDKSWRIVPYAKNIKSWHIHWQNGCFSTQKVKCNPIDTYWWCFGALY